MAIFHINIQDSKFDHGSSVVRGVKEGDMASTQDDAILRELSVIHEKLKSVEPLLADAIANLEMAIKTQNKSKISEIIHQLSIGSAANILSNIASEKLITFLGI